MNIKDLKKRTQAMKAKKDRQEMIDFQIQQRQIDVMESETNIRERIVELLDPIMER